MANNQSERRKLIKSLKEKNSNVYNEYKDTWQKLKKMSHFFNSSNLYELSARGTLNTYALFFERNWSLIAENGYLGIIVPTGLITSYHLQNLFQELVQRKSLLSLFDFENLKKLFKIHRNFRFSLISIGGKLISQEIIPMMFNVLDPLEVQEPLSIIFDNFKNLKLRIKKLGNKSKLIPIEPNDFKLFNPNTLTCPSFDFKIDYELLRRIYYVTSILIEKEKETGNIISNPWKIKFKRIIDMASDSNLFLTHNKLKKENANPIKNENLGGIWVNNEKQKYVPLYEGKMIWRYDHRYNSVKIAESESYQHESINTTLDQHKNTNFIPIPAYWIKENDFQDKIEEIYNFNWFYAYRDIVGYNRIFISTVIPKYPAAHTLPVIIVNEAIDKICCLIANLNSIIIDYVLSKKLSGNHISFYIVEQLPVFPPSRYNKALKHLITIKVLELIYSSTDLEAFAQDLGYDRKPFVWESKRRQILKAELDAIFALLYNIDRNDLFYILDTFEKLSRKEEEEFKEFLTKRLVLEAYDKFSKQKELFE